jgi:hypothetical protein
LKGAQRRFCRGMNQAERGTHCKRPNSFVCEGVRNPKPRNKLCLCLSGLSRMFMAFLLSFGKGSNFC